MLKQWSVVISDQYPVKSMAADQISLTTDH
jgi:hypothetical protein